MANPWEVKKKFYPSPTMRWPAKACTGSRVEGWAKQSSRDWKVWLGQPHPPFQVPDGCEYTMRPSSSHGGKGRMHAAPAFGQAAHKPLWWLVTGKAGSSVRQKMGSRSNRKEQHSRNALKTNKICGRSELLWGTEEVSSLKLILCPKFY